MTKYHITITENESGDEVTTTTVENDIPDFKAFARDLLNEGYDQRWPRTTDCQEDAALIADTTCAACGGMFICKPYVRYSPFSYRLFGVCEQCNTGHEF